MTIKPDAVPFAGADVAWPSTPPKALVSRSTFRWLVERAKREGVPNAEAKLRDVVAVYDPEPPRPAHPRRGGLNRL